MDETTEVETSRGNNGDDAMTYVCATSIYIYASSQWSQVALSSLIYKREKTRAICFGLVFVWSLPVTIAPFMQ